MKTPDQKPNLPKNKKEAAKDLTQQPKFSKEFVRDILAGIGSLPVLNRIKEIGSKLNVQKNEKQPKMNTTKSDAAKAELEIGQNTYDRLIQQERAKYNSLSDNPAHYDEEAAAKIDSEIANLETRKEDQANLYNQRHIPARQKLEKEEFTSKHPLEVLKTENQEYETKMAALQDDFDNASTTEAKGALGVKINKTIDQHAKKTAELKQMDANNKQQIIDLKNQEKESRIAEQKRLDDSIITQFKKTMAHEKEVLARARNIQSIRKDRITDEKQIIKIQKEGKKLTNEADQRLQDIENKEKREAESKWDNEIDHVSIFDKLKNSVQSASEKGFKFIKAKINENDDNLTTERFDSKTGERISSVIDFGSVIKKAEKAIESKAKQIIKETKKSRDKIVKSVESGVEDLINKSNEETDRITSPEIILIKNKIDKDEQELDNLKRKYKILEKLSKDTKTDDGDWAANRIKEMDDLQPKITALEQNIRIGYIKLEVQEEKDDKEYNESEPDKQVRIDNVNIATNQLNRLIKESNKLTLKTKKQAQELRSKKPIIRKDLEKLKKDYDKKKKSLNLKIEELKKVIKDNK